MHLKRLEAVFSEYQRQLYVAALAITRNRAMAEDAVHDSLVAVAATRSAIQDMKAYLFQAVRNRALKLSLARSAQNPLEEDYLDEVSCRGADNHFIRQVKASIDTLDTNERQTLMLKLFEDLSFSEIADITENSPNTVASWYRRGLEKLKEKLHD